MIDPVLPYIDWAVASGFGILDVNIPSLLTKDKDIASHQPKMTEAELVTQMKDVLCYLWDNYLEGYASNYIVLMGVGDAYLGVKQLLTSRGMIPCPVLPTFTLSFSLPPNPMPMSALHLTLPTQIAATKLPQFFPSSLAPYAPSNPKQTPISPPGTAPTVESMSRPTTRAGTTRKPHVK